MTYRLARARACRDMDNRTKSAYSILVLLFAALSASAQLINGNFATGDLTGWTTFNDTNGTTGPVSVVPFDITGTGTIANCAQFEVGSTIVPGYGSLGYGGGISQSVNLAAGQLTVFLNIAAYNSLSSKNLDGATFELVLDGKPVVTNIFGNINGYQTNFSAINYSTTVSAGAHLIAIDMRRAYASNSDPQAGGVSPYQYLSNITLTGSSVPPPLNIQGNGPTVILTWTNATFTLQAAPSSSGIFTNIPGAASPYTNTVTAPQEYFRVAK